MQTYRKIIMKLKVKRLDEKAKLPKKAHESDFGYDVVAISKKRVGWRTWEYRLGLTWAIERDIEVLGFDEDSKDMFYLPKEQYSKINLSIDFRPRSSVYKTGLILCNCIGTIDELYRGEVKAYFYSVNPFGRKYRVGERIGQICLGITLPLEIEEVDELDKNTERGEGGFGSTGK